MGVRKGVSAFSRRLPPDRAGFPAACPLAPADAGTPRPFFRSSAALQIECGFLRFPRGLRFFGFFLVFRSLLTTSPGAEGSLAVAGLAGLDPLQN